MRLRGLALLAASLGALVTVILVAARASYPYHLEFLETNLFCQAVDLRDGGRFYGDPSRDFLPHEYGPLYPALLALLFLVVPPSLAAARAVSTLATIGTVLILAGWTRRSGGSRAAALFAGASYLALFGATGQWFDVARVDSLAVFLLVAGTAATHGGRGPEKTGRGSLLFFFLAAFAKQTMLPIGLLALAVAPLPLRRRALLCGALAGIVVASAIVLEVATDGRFLLYTIGIPLSHPLHPEVLPVLALPPWNAVPLFLAGALLGPSRLASLAIAAFAISAVSLLKEGAWVNDLLPAAAFAAALGGRAIGAIGAVRAAVLALALAFSTVFSPLRAALPTAEDRAAGDALVAYLRAFPGRAWVADFNYFHVLAGRPALPTAYAIGEIAEPLDARRTEIQDLERGAFDLVLADRATPASFRARLEAAYRPDERMPTLPIAPGALRTRTGQAIGPWEVWVPKGRSVALPPFPGP